MDLIVARSCGYECLCAWRYDEQYTECENENEGDIIREGVD